MGPDGEDNSGGDGSKDRQQHLYGGQHMHQQQQQRHNQQQQQRVAALQKRHSVILERAFDFGECKPILPYFKRTQTTLTYIFLF